MAVRSSATGGGCFLRRVLRLNRKLILTSRGEYALVQACKRCSASLFSTRAISYRTPALHKTQLRIDAFVEVLNPAVVVLMDVSATLVKVDA